VRWIHGTRGGTRLARVRGAISYDPPQLNAIRWVALKMSPYLLRSATRAAAVCGLMSCIDIAGGCDASLGVRTTPASAQLAVGQSVTPSVHLTGCGGRKTLTDTFSWAAEDSTVVRVDSTSGRITARQPGSTIVNAIGRMYGRVAAIPVSVVP
jgi:hypothetical protein